VLIVLGVLGGALAAAAFDGESERPLGVHIDLLRTRVRAASPEQTDGTALPATLTPKPDEVTPGAADVAGFSYPIAGACLPESDLLMPGALREYRNAIHEGVDFYDVDNCAVIGLDTEVLAAKGGVVIRADLDYEPLTAERLAELEALVEQVGGDFAAVEDEFRGRQVWIDHGNGVITRYAHLNGIAAGIADGSEVNTGDLVGFVGDSGTPESVSNPGTELHLHFEIRVGDGYLGEDLSPEDVRQLYERAFSS
jgi:murein DD-endopeptidase MepM/ murein hydrolase activator NlpD